MLKLADAGFTVLKQDCPLHSLQRVNLAPAGFYPGATLHTVPAAARASRPPTPPPAFTS